MFDVGLSGVMQFDVYIYFEIRLLPKWVGNVDE